MEQPSKTEAKSLKANTGFGDPSYGMTEGICEPDKGIVHLHELVPRGSRVDDSMLIPRFPSISPAGGNGALRLPREPGRRPLVKFHDQRTRTKSITDKKNTI
ncbi:hypothetical protein MCOR27_011282 [Pyricularia oryzae]|uniref:Uncharacterized protein n=1 Tax=Pyricularia oryzae TaxID=318829 RepID=A0A4V1C5D2_PYROR|nr:hypothetical protein MCOR01_010614 [Pyricularia oryzae]KAI6265755.1 hypothetical protein MCOR27_011282 [Pyricularia oryzae]KAI6311231.1 hypothetical protein MCOR29_008329 [Pyricularia oryzae]KAI6320269.1 hypothetical protein MCOR30_008282 [Pyricularia oryzae]KAI6354503.1 hypothetical protein MCOR32_010525 [Pyricularia oryzae]